jgi:TolA-binding protein
MEKNQWNLNLIDRITDLEGKLKFAHDELERWSKDYARLQYQEKQLYSENQVLIQALRTLRKTQLLETHGGDVYKAMIIVNRQNGEGM